MCRSGKGGGGKRQEMKLHWVGEKRKEVGPKQKEKKTGGGMKSCGQQRGGGVTSSGGEKRVTHLKRGWRKVESCCSIRVLRCICGDAHAHHSD